MDPSTDRFYNLIPPSTYWTGFTIDYDTNLFESSVKSLFDFCLEKLVSNEFYLRHISSRTPPLFYFLLLKKAFDQGRVLSILHLMRQYPIQSFDYPIPNNLTNWSVFLSPPSQIYTCMKSVINILPAVIKTFLTNKNSQLLTLDISQVFFPTFLLKEFLSTLRNDYSLLNSSQTYTLKASFVATFKEDLEILRDVKVASLKNKNFNVEVISLHMHSLRNTDIVMELFHLMDKEELHNFSLEMSSIDIETFIPELQLFSHLQTLNLSYVFWTDLNSKYLTILASALNSFTHLRQLRLRESCLSNTLRRLLKYDCDQIYTCIKNDNLPMDCCIVHRGKLEYLEVSCCKLKNDDLLVLQEFSYARSLKYLNVGNNTIGISSLSDLIEKLGSSLVVLDIECCLGPDDVILTQLFSKFENLCKLKSLNMKELHISEEDMKSLLKALKKMPELRQIALTQTDVLSHFSCKFQKLKTEKPLKIFWSHSKRRQY